MTPASRARAASMSAGATASAGAALTPPPSKAHHDALRRVGPAHRHQWRGMRPADAPLPVHGDEAAAAASLLHEHVERDLARMRRIAHRLHYLERAAGAHPAGDGLARGR